MRGKDRKKFVELANKRVNKAIDVLRLIGNLSNRSNYDYTEADIEKIFYSLNTELKNCRARFSKDSMSGKRAFRLE